MKRRVYAAGAVFAAALALVLACAAPRYKLNAMYTFPYGYVPGYNTPTPQPTPTPEPGMDTGVPEPAPYVYVKGGTLYADFAGVPDFVHYARLDGERIVRYPTHEEDFYYYGGMDITYTYRTKIIDYITGDADALSRYKETIKAIGFKQLDSITSEGFADYMDEIRRSLLYDPDFKLDKDGVFLAECYDTFRLLLIGRSVTVNAYGILVSCLEMRFYSLSRSEGDMLSLSLVVGKLDESEFKGSSFTLYTPSAVADVGRVAPKTAVYGLYTPNAAADILEIISNAVTYSFYTPDALGDVREIAPENVTFLFTPDAVEDINK